MRSPSDMQIIQIELTNACIHRCSNCTRMCGHHKKSFFMDWETFHRAVDSLDGFEGTVGIMGGEPTLHPEFERFSLYLASKYERKRENHFIKPTAAFMEDLLLETRNRNTMYQEKNGINFRIKGPGLWSSLVSNYSRHYELIQDIFYYQCVNDHNNTCYHQPVLISRSDMGIPDEEWYNLRDNCWVQNGWSASITPKGAFFCEIAAALDMLFDGPGGWPIEAGWWRRKPEDFKEQLHWCELCGLALTTRSRNANEEIDDVSPSLYQYLKELGSPKVKAGKVYIYSESPESIEENGQLEMVRKNKYHDSEYNRISKDNHTIYPERFDLVIDGMNGNSYGVLKDGILRYEKQMNRIAVITDPEKAEKLEKETGFEKPVLSIAGSEGGYGKSINQVRMLLGESRFLIVATPEVQLSERFSETLKSYVINPGTYHYNHFSGRQEEKLSLAEIEENSANEPYLAIFHWNAAALRRAGFDRIACCRSREEFEALWEEEKRLTLSDSLLKGNDHTSLTIQPGLRYAVYGTGDGGRRVTEMIRGSHAEIVYYCDSRRDTWGTQFMNREIVSPEQLAKRKDYDKVVIASVAYGEIKAVLEGLGLKEEDLTAPILA